MTRIEHCNITVPDIDAAIAFLQLVAPDFKVRRDEHSPDSFRWVHIGNDDYYIALEEPHSGSGPKKNAGYINYGVNHIALIVPSVAEIEAKLDALGYKRSIEAPVEQHRKRVYFYDNGGFEWEFVEYLSEQADEKYLYE